MLATFDRAIASRLHKRAPSRATSGSSGSGTAPPPSPPRPQPQSSHIDFIIRIPSRPRRLLSNKQCCKTILVYVAQKKTWKNILCSTLQVSGVWTICAGSLHVHEHAPPRYFGSRRRRNVHLHRDDNCTLCGDCRRVRGERRTLRRRRAGATATSTAAARQPQRPPIVVAALSMRITGVRTCRHARSDGDKGIAEGGARRGRGRLALALALARRRCRRRCRCRCRCRSLWQ